ncbi:MAG: glycosyltransferase family 4 protein [bacterium]
MRIVFINDKFPPDATGVGNYAFNLAKKIIKKEHEIVVITSTREKKLEGSSEFDGIKVYRIYSKYSKIFRNYFVIYNFYTIKKVKKILKKEKPDICHLFNIHEYLSFYIIKISKQYSKITVWHARDVMSFSSGKLTHFINKDIDYLSIKKDNYKLPFWAHLKRSGKAFNPLRNFLIRHYLNYADQLFSVSKTLKDAMEANGINKNIKVLYSGIDTEEFHITKEELEEFRKKYNIKNDKKILFFSGRLSYSKGAMQAILTLKEILKSRNDIILLIAGNKDNYAETLLKFAEKNNFLSSIIFTGWLNQKDIKKAYLISDVVLNLSLCLDAFPKVNLEAMAAKKPVIGTGFGGTTEIVLDNETGFIVNPLNVEYIAKKVLYLFDNPDILRQFGTNGYERVKRYFNLDKITDEILDYYANFLKR